MAEKKAVSSVSLLMVLKEESENRLLFSFRSFLWGGITAAGAILIGIFAFYIIFDHNTPLIVRGFVVLLAAAFAYSSVYSLTTRRLLEIDFIGRVVNLSEVTLFRNAQRTEPFDGYKQISISRDSDSTNYSICLESKDGSTELLGWNEFGALSLSSAMELADKIAPRMGIKITPPK